MGQAIVSLRLEPAEGTVTAGQAVQLSLFGATRRGDSSLLPANLAQWSSSNPALAQINRQGRLIPGRAGRVTITARYADKVVSAEFTVMAPPSADAP